MSQCQCSAQQSVTVPGYLNTAGRRTHFETPAQKKVRRRAYERKVKPHDRMISDWAIEQWSDGQSRLITFGYEHKLTSPGVPDKRLWPCVDPERKRIRANGSNIAKIHAVADQALAAGCTAAVLVTITCPGRFHPSYRGRVNSHWDGSTPLDGCEYLRADWKNIRQRMQRSQQAGIIGPVTWYRAREPHKDGTPHDHVLVMFRPEEADRIRAIFESPLKGEEDHWYYVHGIKWERSRNRQGAQSYIRKYVTKNTKGLSPGYRRNAIYRWMWGIRAFAVSQGLRATVYNLLRGYDPSSVSTKPPPELLEGVLLARANKMFETSQWADAHGIRCYYEPTVSFRGTKYKALRGLRDMTTGELWPRRQWKIVPDTDIKQTLEEFISTVVHSSMDDDLLWERERYDLAKDNLEDPDDWDTAAVPTAIEYHSGLGT